MATSPRDPQSRHALLKLPETGDPAKHTEAFHINAVFGGKLHITYQPDQWLCDDPEAKGHLFDGFLGSGLFDDGIGLDDRLPESLPEQVVAELRRISRCYATLARRAARQYRALGMME